MLEHIEISGIALAVKLKRHAKAKRISLRLSPCGQKAIITAPIRANLAYLQKFLDSQKGWIKERLEARPSPPSLLPGEKISVLGQEYILAHHPIARRGVWKEEGVINVSGSLDHFQRRLIDWLKEEAKREITHRALTKAQALEVKFGKITVRDMRSRWGSCSSRGDLAFSWRLILAPDKVFDYVIAHEIAHLKEMNHGPQFWQWVARLCPEPHALRHWLRLHGAVLHLFGR